jgi:hypothetical protein
MADRKKRNKQWLNDYSLNAQEAARLTNNPKLARLTAVRVSNHIARRLGAFYQGLHWTGLTIKQDSNKTARLIGILEQREAAENFVLDMLRDGIKCDIAIAVCEIDDPVAVLGCGKALGAAYEAAYLSANGRRRLYQCLMLLGRLETFLWFLDHEFTAEAVRVIMAKDSGWRGVCRLMQKQQGAPDSGKPLKRKHYEYLKQYNPPIVRRLAEDDDH